MAFEIKDESSTDGAHFQLYVNGLRRGHVSHKKHRTVQLHWDMAGGMFWPEAREVMEGLLELSLIADQLSLEVPSGKIKRKD